MAPLAVFSYFTDRERSFLCPIYFIIASLVIAGMVVYKLIRKTPLKGRLALILTCLIISVFAVLQTLFMFNFNHSKAKEFESKTVRICGYVSKLHTEQNSYSSFIADVTEANQKEVSFSVSVFTNFSPQISVGDIFVCDAYLEPSSASIYYNDTMLKRQNILFTTTIESENYFEITGHQNTPMFHIRKIAEELGYKFDRIFPRKSASLAKALLLGDRYELSEIIERDFRRIGISHILALSGTHLVLIVGFIMYFIKFITQNDKLRFICVALISLFTILLTGASPSILRAGLMLIYYQAGYLLREKSDIMTTLFAVTSGIVIFDPFSILDAGLILSFSATLGIALFSSIVRDISLKIFGNPFSSNIPVKLVRYCFESVCISFCAGVFVTISCVFIFDSVSLISIVSTLIFTPLIITFMLFAAFSLFFSNVPYVSNFLTGISNLLSDTITGLASYFSKKEFVCVSAGYFALKLLALFFIAVFIYFVLKDKKVVHFAVFSICFSLISLIVTGICIYKNSDVTQLYTYANTKEDCIVLSNGVKSTLIDISGGSSNACASATSMIISCKDTDIDTYILTHYHFDHISALKKINNYMLIRKLLLPVAENGTDKEYAMELEETAKRLNIELEYYMYDTNIDINGLRFKAMPIERVGKSTHPRIAVSIDKSNKRLVYSAGYIEKCKYYSSFEDMLKNADYLIKGNHGPKESDTVVLSSLIPAGCKFFVYEKALEEEPLLLRQSLIPYGKYKISSFYS